VTEAEIASFFQAQRGALGERPATVSFEQVIVRPEPSAEARAAARSTAEDVLRQLGAGGDFAVLARRFSADTGSGERGGELGWFRRGQMVRPFENAVYAMRPGETSGLVETEFGFHIIRLERIRAGERQARHILIRAEITEADQARARARADSVATALRGGASVPNLAERYGTPVDQRGGERVPLERLPPAYTTAFATASPGSVVGPFEIVPAPGSSAWAVARLGARQAAGEYTLDDVREQVRGRIQEQKMITQMVAELRRSMHVDVQL
jgi:peptidyl-prolyl cis-trans isomerase SurA